ncbi:hypothetical protein [Duganella caerulea]|uniref:hypothetical protein n=1 Tax=Duganella caerulea TaxID=2885762 RepID=UPI004037A808
MPMPTIKPASSSVAWPASTCTAGSGVQARYSSGAASKPAVNASRQPRSPRRGRSTPPRMPLMPAMRPFKVD